MTVGSLFHFDPVILRQVAEQHRGRFAGATPFSHVVIDGFLPNDVADAVLAEFPTPKDGRWTTYTNDRERKLEGTDLTAMGAATRSLFAELNSAVFLTFLEELTGIEGLIPDPYLHGGGLHQIERGGFLKIHADFNWHRKLRLDRRLNLLIYLNKDWKEEYGGHLELWHRDLSAPGRRILPVFNRCVVFATTDDAFHGHPEPLTCPEGVTRKSLALYYYSNGRPAEEISESHGTVFAARPGEVWRRELPSARTVASRLLPPVVADGLRRLRRRRQA